MNNMSNKCEKCGDLRAIFMDDAALCFSCWRELEAGTKADAKEIGKHYGYDYRGVRLDPYRIFSVYHISHPAQQHAIKKLLRAGESVKSLDDDIAEAIATLQRWRQMRAEDEHQQ